jgi:hypothetical protein
MVESIKRLAKKCEQLRVIFDRNFFRKIKVGGSSLRRERKV